MPPVDDDRDDQPYPEFGTREQAHYHRRHLMGNLRKSKDDAHQRLADKLDHCVEDQPCGSGACPVCMRPVRLEWIDDGRRYVESEWGVNTRTGFLTTLIHPSVEPGQLGTVDLLWIKEQMSHHVDQLSLPERHMIGAIDFTPWLDGGKYTWMGFVHAIAHQRDSNETAKTAQGRHTKRGQRIERPLRFTPIKNEDLPRKLGYTLRSHFGSLPSLLFPFGTSSTKRLPPPDWALRERALWLDSLPVEDRMILRGVRRDHDGLRTVLKDNTSPVHIGLPTRT